MLISVPVWDQFNYQASKKTHNSLTHSTNINSPPKHDRVNFLALHEGFLTAALQRHDPFFYFCSVSLFLFATDTWKPYVAVLAFFEIFFARLSTAVQSVSDCSSMILRTRGLRMFRSRFAAKKMDAGQAGRLLRSWERYSDFTKVLNRREQILSPVFTSKRNCIALLKTHVTR